MIRGSGGEDEVRGGPEGTEGHGMSGMGVDS
jgi:hypothetical protein